MYSVILALHDDDQLLPDLDTDVSYVCELRVDCALFFGGQFTLCQTI